jgi:hypothetical protein
LNRQKNPEPKSIYVVAERPDQAVAKIKSPGGYEIKFIRALAPEESRQFRFLRSAEF